MNKCTSLISALLFVLLPAISFSQKVDTVEINGEEVFVYPFRLEVDESYQYWSAIDRKKTRKAEYTFEQYLTEVKRFNVPDSVILDSVEFQSLLKVRKAKTYRKLSKYYLDKMGEKPTKEEFKRYMRYRRFGRSKRMHFDEESSYYEKKKFKKAVREHPYYFLIQRMNLEQDITPMLDPIPDGKYVQYYDSYCLLKHDGM